MPDDADDRVTCELCGRSVPRSVMTLHHLIPRQKGGKPEHRRSLCKPCHKQLHATFGNADLAKRYATLEQLRDAEPLQGFLAWIRKQKPERTFRTSTSDAHRHARRRPPAVTAGPANPEIVADAALALRRYIEGRGTDAVREPRAFAELP